MSEQIGTAEITAVRERTRSLCEPLAIEDHVVQPADYVSPPKWHLAHTTWFFETFVLAEAIADYKCFDSNFARLFNSYYKSQGEHWQQSARGTLSRPVLDEVLAYRDAIDDALATIAQASAIGKTAQTIEIGLHHEQQHQELLVMDIKAILATNPCMPAYTEMAIEPHETLESAWVGMSGGQISIGAEPADGFSFDNELPRHHVTVAPFAMAAGLVTNARYLEFVSDGGYERPDLWLSDGWDVIQKTGWRAPRYWYESDGGWRTFTLRGGRAIDPREPVSHVSYYEADAFARWAGARLPTEAEWEHAAAREPVFGAFLESGDLAPRARTGRHFSGMHGTLWQWTASPYVAYPGYKQPSGAFGEYNGKFMCNQIVLRGGCYATPESHYRPSYRNFYKPEMRWQLCGIRLAKDSG